MSEHADTKGWLSNCQAKYKSTSYYLEIWKRKHICNHGNLLATFHFMWLLSVFCFSFLNMHFGDEKKNWRGKMNALDTKQETNLNDFNALLGTAGI